MPVFVKVVPVPLIVCVLPFTSITVAVSSTPLPTVIVPPLMTVVFVLPVRSSTEDEQRLTVPVFVTTPLTMFSVAKSIVPEFSMDSQFETQFVSVAVPRLRKQSVAVANVHPVILTDSALLLITPMAVGEQPEKRQLSIIKIEFDEATDIPPPLFVAEQLDIVVPLMNAVPPLI